MFDEIVKWFGGVTAMSRALGTSRYAIYKWNGVVPKGRAYEIEVLTNGKFKAKDIIRETHGEAAQDAQKAG